jgi:hypothetical protein
MATVEEVFNQAADDVKKMKARGTVTGNLSPIFL